LGNSLWVSTVDNNVSNPDSGGANWYSIANVWSGHAWSATGSANAQTLTLVPAPTSISQLIGVPIYCFSPGINTGATTLNVNNLGAKSILSSSGVALWPNSLVSGVPYVVVYNGTNFALISVAQPPAKGQQVYAAAGTFTFTVPNGVVSVHMRAWGAGGGGGGALNSLCAAIGGSGGGYSEGTYSVTPGQTIAITVGASGAAGASLGGNGGTGGTTTIGNFINATGGGGGGGSSSGIATSPIGTVGSANFGQLNLSGIPGQLGFITGNTSLLLGGGGGGAAFFPAITGAVAAGGISASYPGVGGGGASAAAAGGTGGPGLVLLDW
jgi:hypothetical protein